MDALDKDDIQILQLLQYDARLTNKEVADKIGKSITPVYERIKRLENEGYIQRYVAVLDQRKIDKSLTAYTLVLLKEHTREMLKTFEKEAVKLEEVMECYHMAGQYDYLLKIAVKDMDEYADFMLNKLARLSNVGTVHSYFVLNEAKKETAYRIAIPEKPGNTKIKRGNKEAASGKHDK